MKFRAASLVLAMFAPVVLHANGVLLQYNYQENKPLFYVLNMQSASSFTTPDSPERNLKMETHVAMRQELIEKDGDELKIAMTILNALQKVNDVAKPFPQGTNQTQIVRMKTNGTILSTLTPVPGQSPDQNAMQMVFPEDTVEAGKSWTRIKEIAQPIPVETKTLYKITQLGPEQAIISSIMRLENTAGDAINATTKGSTTFNHKLGKIEQSTAESKFQFEIPMKVPGLLPNSANVKVTLDMQIHIKEVTEAEAMINPWESKEKK